jgi:predicted nucleic acid-binding protein
MPCLETDFFVDVFRQKKEALRKLEQLIKEKEPLTVTPVTVAELFRGALKSNNPKNIVAIEETEQTVQLLEFDWPAARTSGELLNRLEKKGEPIGNMDTLTAAICLRHNQTLITKNKKHFAKITGLKTQEW